MEAGSGGCARFRMAEWQLQSPILAPAIQPPAPSKDQIRLKPRVIPGIIWGLLLAGGCMAGGSLRVYEVASVVVEVRIPVASSPGFNLISL